LTLAARRGVEFFVDVVFDPALDPAKIGSSVPGADRFWKF